jgi:hypothetical protein
MSVMCVGNREMHVDVVINCIFRAPKLHADMQRRRHEIQGDMDALSALSSVERSRKEMASVDVLLVEKLGAGADQEWSVVR